MAQHHESLDFDPEAVHAKYEEEREKRMVEGRAAIRDLRHDESFKSYTADPFTPYVEREPIADDIEVAVIGLPGRHRPRDRTGRAPRRRGVRARSHRLRDRVRGGAHASRPPGRTARARCKVTSAEHIARTIAALHDRGTKVFDVDEAAEQAWVDTIVGSYVDSSAFIASCTPSRLNFEGDPAAANPRHGAYGRSFGDYFGWRDIITEWRETGLPGLEIDEPYDGRV